MELILWRHADAEDGAPDLERRLTPKGRKEAERVAAWLLAHLPAGQALLTTAGALPEAIAPELVVRVEGGTIVT